jgi:mRNA interferase MazF
MEERKIMRGDIYRADLTPVVGSEQGGSRRPVLIISNNIGNKHSPTVIIAAITGLEHTKANLPTHIIVKGFEPFEKDSIILLEQIRTIDKKRLQEYVGTFDRRLMLSVDKALAISVALDGGVRR